MIPLSMVGHKVVASSCAVVFFLFGGILTFSYYLPIYFQAVRGVTPTLSGVLSQMAFAILSGYSVASEFLFSSHTLARTYNTSFKTWLLYPLERS